MKIYDVPMQDVQRFARDIGVRFEGDDVSNSRGFRVTGSLKPPYDAPNPYQRVSSSWDHLTKAGKPRKIAAVCWHGYRDFMRAVFSQYPNARIVTGYMGATDYRGSADFEAKFEATGDRNFGSQLYPLAFRYACTCNEED